MYRNRRSAATGRSARDHHETDATTIEDDAFVQRNLRRNVRPEMRNTSAGASPVSHMMSMGSSIPSDIGGGGASSALESSPISVAPMNMPSPPAVAHEILSGTPDKRRVVIDRSEQNNNNVRILKPSTMSSRHEAPIMSHDLKIMKPIMREITNSINQLQGASPELVEHQQHHQIGVKVLKPSHRVSSTPASAPQRDPAPNASRETGHTLTVTPNKTTSNTNKHHPDKAHSNNEDFRTPRGETTMSELASLIRRLQAEVESLQSKIDEFIPEVVGRDLSPPWSHALTLQPKDKVVIMGTFPDSGRLTINLCGSNSIPFSFDVRFSSVSRKTLELSRSQRRGSIRAEPAVEVNEVLVTSNPDSKIQEDNVAIVEPVILKDSPFEPSADFTLEICCYWGSFVVLADGKFLLDYKYRVPVTQVQSIYVLGNPGFVHMIEKRHM